MKRVALITIVVLVLIIIIGYVSNAVSKASVENYVREENRDALEQVTRLWHLQAQTPRPVEESAVLIRIERTPEGRAAKVSVPPGTPLPFEYAHARPMAPFLFRVYYGWAIGGQRMAFGEGGEKIVLAVFGRTIELRTQPHWNF